MSKTAPNLGFTRSEYHQRLQRAQSLMREQNMDGILLMSEPEVRYFSGFKTLFWQSPTRPWFLFLPRDGQPIAIIPEIGADLMQKTWIDDIRTWAAPNPSDDGIELLSAVLRPLCERNAALGILKGHETSLRMPLGDYERLISGLSGLKIVDATPLIRALRMTKSEAEIEKIAYICGVASHCFERAPTFFTTGQSLIEVFRRFKIECLKSGADDVAYLVGGVGQGGYSDVISPPNNRQLEYGDILMLDTGAVFDGYYCDFDRNFAIGPPSAQASRANEILYQATKAGLQAARPGATCRDLYKAMAKVIDQKQADVGRFGPHPFSHCTNL